VLPIPDLSSLPPPPPGRIGWPWTEPGPASTADGLGIFPVDLPTVAVVTPSYQQAEFIEETIRSVLLQGYPKLIYVILDGGSTDGSVAIIEKYADWLSGWVTGPDGGQAAAIDKGFEMVGGEILAWLNSDDVFEPGAIWTAVGEFIKNPGAVLIYGDAEKIARDGTRMGRAPEVQACDKNHLLTENNAIVQPSAFFRRAAYDAAGKLDHALWWALDYDLWLRLADVGTLVYVPQRLSQTRLYAEAKTGSGSPKMFKEIRAVVERNGGQGMPAQMAWWLECTLLPRATTALRQGNLASGQPLLASVINNVPAWRSQSRLAEFMANLGWRRIADGGEDTQAALAWVSQLCLALPDESVVPKTVERQALGLINEALAFRSFSQKCAREGLSYAARAIAQDRQRAANRGLWSAAIRALLGR